MPRPRIEYHDDPSGLAVPFFWDRESKIQVMPQEVVMRYNEMAFKLDLLEHTLVGIKAIWDGVQIP